ncbi:MAG: Uma2 family endonuclease [Acidobacteria bacterium]|nr:Uma2 family endonuclease [Acidobacteriota bacterium]
MALAARRYTELEYAAMEEMADHRSEFFNGEIFAMTGGTRTHSRLCIAVLLRLETGVAGSRCEVLDSNLRIRIAATGLQTYPDASVVCGDAQFWGQSEDCVMNPRLIVEVHSKGTASYGRGKKFEHYKQIPSLQEYVLVWQDRMRIEVFRREAGWAGIAAEGPSATARLESIGVDLPLAGIYTGILR